MLEKPNREYPEYSNWKNMRARCNCLSIHKNRPQYTDKQVCKEWDSFEQFYLDMGPKPTPRHSIDRIDNSKGYEPSNCRWADNTVQARNQGKVKTFTYKGFTGCIPEIAEHFNINANSIHKNMQRGHSIEAAVDFLLRDSTITYNGLSLTKAEWADYLGIKRTTMYSRFNRLGDDLDRILKA